MRFFTFLPLIVLCTGCAGTVSFDGNVKGSGSTRYSEGILLNSTCCEFYSPSVLSADAPESIK